MYRGAVGMNSMGSVEPINFQKWVLEPINSWAVHMTFAILALKVSNFGVGIK